jgi:hypothetical protein
VLKTWRSAGRSGLTSLRRRSLYANCLQAAEQNRARVPANSDSHTMHARVLSASEPA